MTGVGILGNARLVALPLVLAGFAVACAGRSALLPAVVVLVAALVVVLPWTARNRVLARLLHPDDRRPRALEGEQPVDAANARSAAVGSTMCLVFRERRRRRRRRQRSTGATGRIVATDECAQMRFYRHRALTFVRDTPRPEGEARSGRREDALAAVGSRVPRDGAGAEPFSTRRAPGSKARTPSFSSRLPSSVRSFFRGGSRRSRCCCLPTSR